MKCWIGCVWIVATACKAHEPAQQGDRGHKLNVAFREVPLSEIDSDPGVFELQRKYPLDRLLANSGVSNSQFWVAQNHVWYETHQPLSQIGIDFDTSQLTHQKKICLFQKPCAPIYFGTLHSHTQDSDGSGTITDAFRMARDVAKLDFFAVTDHSEYLNFESAWQRQKDIAATQKTRDFLPMVGFEYSHALSGHFVLLGTKRFTSAWRSKSLASFYEWLKIEAGSVSIFAHPGYHRIRKYTDFGKFDMTPAVIPNMIGVETIHRGVSNNFLSGFTGAQSYLDDAIDQGWHVGPVASQDNHSQNWGIQDTARVATPLPNLDESHLLQSLRDRRFYATQIEGQLLDLIVHIEGRTYQTGDVVSLKKNGLGSWAAFTIRYLDPNSFEPIFGFEVIQNGEVVGSYFSPSSVEKKRSDKLKNNRSRWQKILTHIQDVFYDVFMNGLGFLGDDTLPDLQARRSKVSIGEFKFDVRLSQIPNQSPNTKGNRNWVYVRLWQGMRGELLTQSSPVTFSYADETLK